MKPPAHSKSSKMRSGLYRTKSVGALSHTLGGARKRILVHQNGNTSSYIWDLLRSGAVPRPCALLISSADTSTRCNPQIQPNREISQCQSHPENPCLLAGQTDLSEANAPAKKKIGANCTSLSVVSCTSLCD